MGSWQLYRQTSTAVYRTVYSRQSSYTDRDKLSHLMRTGGAYAPIKKKLILVISEKFSAFNLAVNLLIFKER